MDKNIKNSKGGKKIAGVFLKSAVSALLSFAVCILILPLLLMRTEDPASFVSAASVGIMAVTSFFCAFAASRSSNKHFLISGIICALALCLLLTGLSFLFDTANTEKDTVFSIIIYAVTTVFSLFGAALGRRKPGGKKRTKRRR